MRSLSKAIGTIMVRKQGKLNPRETKDTKITLGEKVTSGPAGAITLEYMPVLTAIRVTASIISK